MQLKQVVATGDPNFLYRYQYLLKALEAHCQNLQRLPCGDVYNNKLPQKVADTAYKVLYKVSLSQADKIFHKNPKAYIAKSRNAEKKIRQLPYKPDFVLQIFGLFSPFWDNFDIPYGMYLDYTMKLAADKWSPWCPFDNPQDLDAWLECERRAYQNATHLFPMSQMVKQCLIEDYGVKPEKITVVASAGNFHEPYEGKKKFGTYQLLFNGSDFERKGGPLVLEAFQKVRQALPQAQLVIIGKKIDINEIGILNPGRIRSHDELRDIFLNTDIVVAPSYCEPFQEFLLEALNYGVPCVVSDRDGMPEIVEQGVNGILVDQLTPEAIAQTLISLLRDPKRLAAMSDAARSKIQTTLNWDSIAQKIVNALT
ncbi:MAG: glycosyltransferase family 4 protein [Desertifilum sp. SIO1I2]|nr:glycosyltransferase family 4 protein [Desertifilum sp. SIO1I2]